MTDLLGAITGFVGMCTGIYGAVTGHLAYQRAKQFKNLDLRLELKKGLSEARTSITNLRTMMDEADQSRRAILSMKGLQNSGAMAKWAESLTADRNELDRIETQLRSQSADFSTLSSKELESEIVAAHELKFRLHALSDKYRRELDADELSRSEQRQRTTAAVAARL